MMSAAISAPVGVATPGFSVGIVSQARNAANAGRLVCSA
jgi:hypothetical protein